MIAIRRHRRSIAGLAASLFLAVWASMALAPCLMAAEAVIGEDCPHCPGPPPPCHEDGAGTNCAYLDGYDFDGRVPGVPKVEIELVAVPPLALAAAELPPGPALPCAREARAPPEPSGPRLHLRNCVLID
jgi:hypothetical protein